MHKRVLIVTEVFDPEVFLINEVVSVWEKKGFQVEVLTRNPSYPNGKIVEGYKNNFYKKSKESNLIVHRFLFIPGYQKSLILKLLNYLNYIIFSFLILIKIGRRFDKIFIYQTGPLSNALAPSLLKFIFRWKIILWSQDLWPETIYAYGIPRNKLINLFVNALVKFIYSKSDIILVSCKGFIDRIIKYTDAPKFDWIPNWNLVSANCTSRYEFNQGFNFTFAGNIGKVQNLENVIKAFASISEKNSNVYFNIFGSGSNLESLKILTKNINAKNVIFHGRKRIDEMPAIFCSSDVLLLSLVDAPIYKIMIPSKFQAYLSAKKPIFSIVSGELNKMVEEYKLGYTAEPSNIDEITEGFLKFINSKQTDLSSISKNAELLEKKYFEKELIINKITEFVWS